MIEHIVLFKLKTGVPDDEKRRMLDGLLTLKSVIPGIIEASAGVNFSDRAKGYTHGFVVRFRDRAALDAYIIHPEHRRVVETLVKPVNDDVLAVDYEIIS